MELLPVLYKIYSKIFRISVFNLNIRPFPVGVHLQDQRWLFTITILQLKRLLFFKNTPHKRHEKNNNTGMKSWAGYNGSKNKGSGKT